MSRSNHGKNRSERRKALDTKRRQAVYQRPQVVDCGNRVVLVSSDTFRPFR